MRYIDLAGSPEEMGYTHGRMYATEIRRYLRDRVDLVASGLWSGASIQRDWVLELAEACLPAHEAFSPRLHTEMLAMAAGAGISPAEAVVVGGFTDFVDTVRAVTGGVHPPEVIEDDCTAFIVPDQKASGAGMLGQTWDMHSTATEYVALARLHPDDGPDVLLFTTVGCLGQIGMNSEGVCVGINNLNGGDGCFGVTWPTVVRQMLTTSTAAEAMDVLLGANLAGAHNYLILDSDGRGFNVEAMPSARPVHPLADEPLVHTNHATSPLSALFEVSRNADLLANSYRRLELAETMLANGSEPVTVDQLKALTREPTTICRRVTDSHKIESSGAVIMRPRTSDFWACLGIPIDNHYQHFTLTPTTTRHA